MKQTQYNLVILGLARRRSPPLRAQELGRRPSRRNALLVAHASIGVVYCQKTSSGSQADPRARHPVILVSSPRRSVWISASSLSRKTNHRWLSQKKYKVIGDKITIEQGHATFVDDRMIEVDGKRLTGDKILIATGSSPVIRPLGLDEALHQRSHQR
jgi:hypothetical protein